ncbi:hypothetical protein CKO10_16970, partial [Rhodospirillum rubrum]|uniref:hypothetical protein n=1 Tax=Rhodospirillum rubrum TaxID=1085 RepID=UPI001908BFD4
MTDGPAVDTPPPPDETPDLRAALAEREAEVAALNARLAASQARLAQASEARLRAAVLEACARAGVRDLSRADVCRAAREVFTLSDGLEVVALPGVEAAGGLDGWLAGLRRTGAAAWWE